MRKETAKRIMDAAYETRKIDVLRRLCQIACEAATTLDSIVTDQLEFQRRQDDRIVELTLTFGKEPANAES